MNEKTPTDLALFTQTAMALLAGLKPTLEGVRMELSRQARQSHDHEDFLKHEFRDVIRAIDGLTAQLSRM